MSALALPQLDDVQALCLRADTLPLAAVRSQAAVVRMLVDQLECVAPDSAEARSMREQLNEEHVRLGTRIASHAAAAP
jgi:hypothetical protein